MNMKSLSLLLAFLALASTARADRFSNEFARWEAHEATNPAPAGAVLFVGSSTFTRWHSMHQMMAPLDVCKRGFGGSTMAETLMHTNHFMPYRCTRVVVYQGDNDLCRADLSPAMFVAHCQAFVAAMRATQPQRQIFFLSVKPSIARWRLFDKQSAANTLLRVYAQRTPGVHFIDIVLLLLDDKLQPDPAFFVQDNLHVNEQAYQRFAAEIRVALNAQ